MLWTQIDVVTASEASEAIANLFWETGANGVCITDNDDSTTITAFLPNDDLIGDRVFRLRQLLAELKGYGIQTGRAEIQLTSLEDEDWAHTWRSAFPPQRIGERWLVAPSWEQITPAPHDRLIVLDPGMAFGTGYHPTTKLVLCLMEEVMYDGESVLDLGTGSGILAIAASQLGAASVTATDIDEQSLKIAQENARKNNVAQLIEWKQGNLFEGIHGQYDLILANILTKVLLPMISGCRPFLRPNGRLILSGILRQEDKTIRRALNAANLKCLETRTMDEWMAYLVG